MHKEVGTDVYCQTTNHIKSWIDKNYIELWMQEWLASHPDCTITEFVEAVHKRGFRVGIAFDVDLKSRAQILRDAAQHEGAGL